MKEAIRFKGLSLSRDELATEKGELALCGGVEVCDGALRASVLKGEEKVDLGTGKKLVYIHKLTDPDTPEVYIVFNESDSKLYSIVSGGQYEEICALSTIGNKVTSVESIGNTLIIIGDKVKVYALWKRTNNEYLFLGEKPPMVDMRFQLSNKAVTDYYDTDAVVIVHNEESEYTGESSAAFGKTTLNQGVAVTNVFKNGKITEEYQAQITDMIWAIVNKTNSVIAEHNRFYAPFFVRYCYRLYDGSMYYHSAPVLMLTIEDTANQVVCLNLKTGNTASISGFGRIPLPDSNYHEFSFDGITAMYVPINAGLQYKISISSAELSALNKWKDIIKSVDVFISQPIYHYNTSSLIKSTNTVPASPTPKLYTDSNTLLNYNNLTNRINRDTQRYNEYDIPRLLDNGKNGDYTDISTFFKAYSFNIEDIKNTTSYTDLPMADGTVKSIVGREKMTDDYKSHNSLYVKGQYIYNKRVNLFGLSEKLFDGFPFKLLANTCTGIDTTYTVKGVMVKLETNEGTKYVETSDAGSDISKALLQRVPLYYPDARATEMQLLCQFQVGSYKLVTLKMKAASELNGSWTDIFSYSESDYDEHEWPDLSPVILSMDNKIYTSEVNNPYYFPLNGINTVGTGEIKGLASTTRALSQGQFGQYPLLAFSTDGIWALSVSNTGTYSTIHPLSREVCENADSITQLDQSVLFATSRGINRIVQSDVNLLSAILDGPYDGIAKTIATDIATTSEQAFVNFDRKPVDVFMKAKPVYDFVNSRVLFFNGKEAEATKKSIVMVLSLKDGTWSMMKVDGWKNVVNGYPYPFVQYSDGKVYELSKSYNYDDNTKYKGIIVTRTLTFDGLIKFIQGWEHVCECDAPKLVIYGSNDLKANWKKIGVSTRMIADTIPGYPFKYFRVGLLLDMKTSERYSHLILDVKEKYSHQ